MEGEPVTLETKEEKPDNWRLYLAGILFIIAAILA